MSYLLMSTGLHGDDYAVIDQITPNLLSFFSIEVDKILTLSIFTYYGLWWPYFLFGYEYQWAYDLIKVISHLASFIFVYKFFADYFSKDRSILAAFLFILYPLHDTTTYWYATVPYILVPSTILYAHHLVRNNSFKSGFVISFLGAFSSYISPPYIFGLTVIFFFERKYKKALIFATPGFLYVMYYFWIKFNYVGIERRINADLSVLDYLKQLLVQPISFLESAIGPSYWFKVFYAIESISLTSVIIVIVVSTIAYRKVELVSKKPRFSKSLFIGLISVLVLSFFMYALTGLYSHSAFNLGNRSTVYGSLLIAFLLAVYLPANKKSVIFLMIIFLAPVFGLSDHWKSWNNHQKILIENVNNNQKLKSIEIDSTLLVTGNSYSKLGPFSHIDFFSIPWSVSAILNDSAKTNNILALTSYTAINGDYISDPKFGSKYSLITKLYVYESESDRVREIFASDVPKFIEKQPRLIRHWVQLFKDTWIQDVIVWLSPSLVYLFK
jgi:hypothetical protein